jgi:transcriptional regulator with XRE-family HTH domain
MRKSRVKSIHDKAYQAFVDYLRRARLDAGLTQTELAARLHTDQSYVSKYERAERRLDIVELRLLCQHLNTSLIDFVEEFEQELKRRGLV